MQSLPINQIILGDAIETMRELPDTSIDAIISDPPYGTTAISWDKKIDWEAWWKEAHRITKPSSIICLFSAQPFTTDLINSNRKNFRAEIIWEKSIASGFLNARKSPLRSHENILIFCSKPGKSTYNPQMTPGVPYSTKKKGTRCQQYSKTGSWTTRNESGDRYPRSVQHVPNPNYKSLHPTQKPLALMQWLVKTYSNVGDVVLDPFTGSGSTASACIETGRNFIGIENSAHYHSVAHERIATWVEAA